ncbi:MAG: contractile injection system protein, VgrG/Pvc8 family [Defluviitaleaceae bacterium]|nr:contractile injection system protein, VgrG/Pvc8 family [Defluviitaleaceae bacterium]
MNHIRRDNKDAPASLFMKPTPSLSITFEHLNIAPYEVVKMLDVQMRQEMNEHGTLYVKALLSDEQGQQYAQAAMDGKNVVLSAGDHILFQGLVRDACVSFRAGSYELEVHGISYSYLLDLKQKSRSFQDLGMSYSAVAEAVMGAYGGGIMDMASGGAAIGQFILQYLETDWQFLKRLASHFKTGLVCDPRFNKPMVYLGIAHVQAIELDQFNYEAGKDLKRYHYLSQNKVTGISEADFIRYTVDTNQVVNIGDQVRFQGQSLCVLDCLGRVDRGIFMNRLILSPIKGFAQAYRPHHEAAGCSFSGKVIDVKNDQVKVHLDIDEAQDTGSACWFKYSTVYSSQDGSGFYCMPEMGDTIRLYVPDGDDDHAYAISSVHEPVSAAPSGAAEGGVGAGIAPGGTRDDPEVKSLRTPTGKEIRLTPEGIFILSEGAVIVLTKEDGIMIHSENDIEFKSEKSIILAAEEDVNIVGTEGVELHAETASLSLEEDVHIIGQEVMSNGGA